MVYELHRQNGALEDVAHIDAGTVVSILELAPELWNVVLKRL